MTSGNRQRGATARPGVAPSETPQRRAVSDDHGTRRLLVEAALRVISAQGTAQATSRRIANEAGVNLAAITYHFGSKDALVRTALASQVEALVEPALALLESEADPSARSIGAVQLLMAEFESRANDAPTYLEALVAAGRGDPEDEPTRLLISDVRSRLSTVIAAQLDGGLVPGWVDPDAMAALIIAAANGIALQSVLDPGGASVSRQADQLLRLFLAAAVQSGAADGVRD